MHFPPQIDVQNKKKRCTKQIKKDGNKNIDIQN